MKIVVQLQLLLYRNNSNRIVAGWKLVHRGKYTDFNIQATPLQIKVENRSRTKSLFDIYRSARGSTRDIIVVVTIVTTTRSHLKIFEEECMWEVSVNRVEPSREIIWTFAKTRTEIIVLNEEGRRWKFRFSESEVAQCREWGGGEYDKIHFRAEDSATLSYRPLPFSSGN